MSIDAYATIPYQFSLPINLAPGAEISIRARPYRGSYPQTLRVKATKSGPLAVKLTDPAGDTFRLKIDMQKGTASLVDPVPMSEAHAQDFTALLMRDVSLLSRRLAQW